MRTTQLKFAIVLNCFCLGVRPIPEPKQKDTAVRQRAARELKVERQILVVGAGRVRAVAQW